MPFVLKSGSLNLLEPSGPVKACNGIALPLLYRALLDAVQNNHQYAMICTTALLFILAPTCFGSSLPPSDGSRKLPHGGRLRPKHVGASIENKAVVQIST
jgi:hypothetical protein